MDKNRNKAINAALEKVVAVTHTTDEDEKKAVREILRVLYSQAFVHGMS